MDTSTGRLVRDDLLEQLNEAEKRQFTPVPEELEAEAEEILAGLDEGTVDLRSGTPLARWAVQENRKNKARRRQANKKARASRRVNRK